MAHTLTCHPFRTVTVKVFHGVILRFISIFMIELEFNLREMVLMIKDFIDSYRFCPEFGNEDQKRAWE